MTTSAFDNFDVRGVPAGSSRPRGETLRERVLGFLASFAAVVFVVVVSVDLSRDVFLATAEEMGGPAEIPVTSAEASSPPSEDPLAARGAEVFAGNGCVSCHSVDGSDRIGPSLLGAWGTQQVLVDGARVLFTEDYFYESVLNPQARLVRGFESAMPSYEGLIGDEDLDALAAYVRSLQ